MKRKNNTKINRILALFTVFMLVITMLPVNNIKVQAAEYGSGDVLKFDAANGGWKVNPEGDNTALEVGDVLEAGLKIQVVKESYFLRGYYLGIGENSGTFHTDAELTLPYNYEVKKFSTDGLNYMYATLVPTELTGEVSISGTLSVNETLTATYSGGNSASAAGHYTYQWYRGSEAIPYATKQYYTLQRDDRGNDIYVKITGDNAYFYGTIESNSVRIVSKLEGIVLISGSYSVGETLTAQFYPDVSTNPTFSYQWYRDGEPIEGATSNTYTASPDDAAHHVWIEVIGTGDYTDSVSSIKTKTVSNGHLPQEAPAVGEGFTINYLTETITALEGYEVSTSNETLIAPVDGKVTPGTVYYVRKAAKTNYDASEWTGNTIAVRPEAPKGLEGVNTTNVEGTDGKVAGVEATMEYSVDNGTSWTAVTGTEITGLSAGTVLVRVKATESSFAGANAEVPISDSYTHVHNDITFVPWLKNDSLPTEAGNFVITQDVTLTETWEPVGTTNLCLNGHSIKYNGSSQNASVIFISEGVTLNLYDCSTDGIGCITGGKGYDHNSYGGGIYIDRGVLNMYGGTIKENSSGYSGGGVYVCGGTFNMRGGKIVNNETSYYGGGVLVTEYRDVEPYIPATFNMYGGTISYNSAGLDGGGVHIEAGTTFNMYGGTISYNSSGSEGGGVYVNLFRNGQFYFYDGHISNNTAQNGGGVLVYNVTPEKAGAMIMTGGSIDHNTSTDKFAGGVMLRQVGGFKMTGGSITDNDGYGVYATGDGATVFGGTAVVKDNSIDSIQKNVYVWYNERLAVGTGQDAPSEGMYVGVTIPSGRFTTNGTANDAKYFVADNTEYEVFYNPENYLELKKSATPGHILGTYHEAVPGNCTDKGTIAYYDCADTTCDKKLDSNGNELTSIEGTIDPENHKGTATTWILTDATHKEIYDCCGAVKTAETNHTYGTTGAARYTCTVCSYEDAVKKAEAELADAKEEAKAALDAEDAKDPLTDKTPVTTGKANIEAAATKAAVESAKNAAIKAIQDARANKPAPNPVIIIIPQQKPTVTPEPTQDPGATQEPEVDNQSGITEKYQASVESDKDTVMISADITNGVAVVDEIGKALLKEMFAKDASATENESDVININLSETEQTVEGAELTKQTVTNLADAVNNSSYRADSVAVVMGEATVELDAKTLETIRDTMAGDTIRLVVEKNANESLNDNQKNALEKCDVAEMIDVYMESNGVRIHDFKGGNVAISVEFTPEKGKKTENYKVYYIDDDGKLMKHATKYENGKLTFVTGHFSDYVVIYDNVQDVLLTEAATTEDGYIKLSWNEIDGAVKYVVRGAKCSKSYTKLAELDAEDGSSFTVKKISGAKPASGKTYKFYVAAYDALGNKIKSKSIHYIAGDVSAKYANVKTITPVAKTLELAVGEKLAVGAEYAMYEDKKHTPEKHGKALRFTSDCPEVAKVSKSGTVTAKSAGTAVIYIQDISGKWCQVEVTVKEK